MSEKKVDNKESLWKSVVDADRTMDSNRITAAVFSFLLFRLQTEAGLTTGAAIAELEQKFRADQMQTHCVALKTVEPYQSCTFDKQPTKFHLFLVADSKAHVRDEYRRQGISNARQNAERLLLCGFLENATEAALKERRMKAVSLPSDLDCTTLGYERCFDIPSLSYYAPSQKDAIELRNKCLEHAAASRSGVLSDALSLTGVQMARTSVPLEKWARTKEALLKQMKERMPIAETARAAVDPKIQFDEMKKAQDILCEKRRVKSGKEESVPTKEEIAEEKEILDAIQRRLQEEADSKTCIREQLLPVGYQLLGVTCEPPRVADEKISPETKYALFDLYSVTERKYHVSFTDEEFKWLEEVRSATAKEEDDNEITLFRQLLSKKIGSESTKEMEGITFENARRHVHIVGRGPMPL